MTARLWRRWYWWHLLPSGRSSAPSDRPGGFAEVREGLRFSYSHHRLRFYIPVGTSVWLLLGLVGALEPLFSRDVLGTGPEAIGWVSSIVGIGLVGGTLLAPLLPLGGSWGQRRRRPRGLDGLGRSSTSALASPRWWPWGFMWGSIIGTFAPIVRTLIHLNSPRAWWVGSPGRSESTARRGSSVPWSSPRRWR